jgi:hypothetical protein
MAFYTKWSLGTSLAFIFSIIAVVLFFLYNYRRIRPHAKIAVMEDQERNIKVKYVVHDIDAYDAGEAAVVRHMNKVNVEEAWLKMQTDPRPGGGHYGEGRPDVNLDLL